jgi:hypothetical protein
MRLEVNREVDRATNKLAHQLTNQVDRMVSGWIWGLFIMGLLLICAVIFGIYLFYSGALTGTTPLSKNAVAAQWDGKATFTCRGNESLILSGVSAALNVTAIEATGNCKLTLTQMILIAPTVIEAKGNATVLIQRSTLNGTTATINASANAVVSLSETQLSGPTKKSGTASINGLPK